MGNERKGTRTLGPGEEVGRPAIVSLSCIKTSGISTENPSTKKVRYFKEKEVVNRSKRPLIVLQDRDVHICEQDSDFRYYIFTEVF